MATIINNPPTETRDKAVLVESADSSAGWAVAVVVLIAVIVGGVYWYTHHRAAAPAQNPSSTNINVTLPAGSNDTGATPATQ